MELVYFSGAAIFWGIKKVLPSPNLNLTGLLVPSPNRGHNPLTPVHIPLKMWHRSASILSFTKTPKMTGPHKYEGQFFFV